MSQESGISFKYTYELNSSQDWKLVGNLAQETDVLRIGSEREVGVDVGPQTKAYSELKYYLGGNTRHTFYINVKSLNGLEPVIVFEGSIDNGTFACLKKITLTEEKTYLLPVDMDTIHGRLVIEKDSIGAGSVEIDITGMGRKG